MAGIRHLIRMSDPRLEAQLSSREAGMRMMRCLLDWPAGAKQPMELSVPDLEGKRVGLRIMQSGLESTDTDGNPDPIPTTGT